MEEKVIELCEAAKRGAEAAATMMDGGLEEAQCIDALNQLINSSLTCQLLVSTQVVRKLLPLTKHPRQKIQDYASHLIVSWRKMFIEQMKRDEKNGKNTIWGKIEPANMQIAKVKEVDQMTFENFDNSSDVKVVKVQKVDENGSWGSKKVVRSEIVVAGETNSMDSVNVEGVIREEKQASGVAPQKLISMINCNDYFRDSVREKLYKALCKVSGEVREDIQEQVNSCDPIQVAVAVESVMFENWGHSIGTYEIKYRSILFNLKDPKNPDFRRKVLLGHVTPKALTKMTLEEVLSDASQRLNKRMHQERARRESQPRFEGSHYLISRVYTCGRCWHRKTTYDINSAFNAADDGVWVRHIQCLNCYQYWESSNLISGLLPI